jgi:hypothetical protein
VFVLFVPRRISKRDTNDPGFGHDVCRPSLRRKDPGLIPMPAQGAAMKIWSGLGVAAIAALSSAGAVATSPQTGATGAQASAAAPAPGALQDARSLRSDRLRKCKEMEGDEKKACQKDAQADFDKAMGRARTKHARPAPAPQSR